MVSHTRNPHKARADFSAKNSQARGEWENIFQVLKEKKKVNQEYLI